MEYPCEPIQTVPLRVGQLPGCLSAYHRICLNVFCVHASIQVIFAMQGGYLSYPLLKKFVSEVIVSRDETKKVGKNCFNQFREYPLLVGFFSLKSQLAPI